MPHKAFTLFKGERTEVALVWMVRYVGATVCNQVRLSCKAAVTVVTLVRMVTCVRAEMSHKVGLVGKTAAAMITMVRMFSRVNAHMPHQLASDLESFTAVSALQLRLSSIFTLAMFVGGTNSSGAAEDRVLFILGMRNG